VIIFMSKAAPTLWDQIWAWIAAEATPIVAVATVITALVAIFALRATASDSRERSRPVVLALFRLAPHDDKAFDLVVKNYGQSAARKVTVKFNPEFGEEPRKDRMTEILAQRFDATMPLLPPGVEVSNLWWSSRPEQGSTKTVNALKTPDNVTVTISYKGNRIRRYKEVIPLDSRWMKLDSSSVSSDSLKGHSKTVAQSVKVIADAVRPGLRALQEIADSVTPDDEEELEVRLPPGPPLGSYERAVAAFGIVPEFETPPKPEDGTASEPERAAEDPADS
jgi:hypothetical protein